MFVNAGAYVDEGTMIDSHALVGSCAQIGKRVHISAAAQIGGVLEPVGAVPVIIEDDVLVGGNCGVYEGTIVRERAVLASGTILTGSTPVYDLVRGEIYQRNADGPLEIPGRRSRRSRRARGQQRARTRLGSLALCTGDRQISRREDRIVRATRGLSALKSFVPPARLQGIEKSVIRQVFDRARPGSINLGLGEPDLPTPDVIRRAAVRAITEEQNGYTSHAGLPELREESRGRLCVSRQESGTRRHHCRIAGSFYLALLTLVDEGDEVLLPDPGFVAYPTIVRMAGGVARFYRLPRERDFGFDADEFRAR